MFSDDMTDAIFAVVVINVTIQKMSKMTSRKSWLGGWRDVRIVF